MAVSSPGSRDVLAAGVVVLRPGRQVLVVHRPKYDDWSFPKGKLERGEHPAVAAVREAEEETGLRVRLHRPLADQRYPVEKGIKRVHYWTARLVDPAAWDVSGYAANAEIDEVRWVGAAEAARLLTYPHDRATLAEALRVRKRTDTLVVLRHAEAQPRRGWEGEDRLRPLLDSGRRDAEALVGILAAYDVRRVVSSPGLRCVETVQPYVEAAGVKAETVDVLSEEGFRPKPLRRLAADLLDDLREDVATVVCTHRPVLPELLDALGVEAKALEKGELLVLHVRKGRVRAVERHLPR